MRNSINMETILNYTRALMYGLTIRIMLQILFLAIYFIVFGSAEQNIRGLEMSVASLPNSIPCDTGTISSNCTCPANCLMYVARTGGCHPIDCWSYSTIKNECNEAGAEFLPALLLQIFLGEFGSGFGNMGRWDIFSIYMAVMFGGCLMVCCCGMCCNCINKEEDKESATIAGSKCGSCLWAVAISTMWIWGIVVIANKEIDAPWTDWEGHPIMCQLVD
jgi:hypothetical protein